MKSSFILIQFVFVITLQINAQVRDSIDINHELTQIEIHDTESLKKYNTLFIRSIEKIDPKLIKQFSQKIIDSAKELKEYKTLYSIGYHLFYYNKTINNDLDKELYYATIHYEASLELAKTYEDPGTILSDASNNLGIAYHDRTEFYNAFKYYLLAVEQSQESKISSNASLPLSNIASLYAEMGDLDNSLKYLKYSIPYAKSETDTVYRAMSESMIYLTLSKIYEEKDMWDSTSFYRNRNNQVIEGSRLDKRPNIQEHICNSYLFSASSFLNKKQLDSANYYLNKAKSCKDFANEAYVLTEFHFCLESDSCDPTEELFDNIENEWPDFKENSLYKYYLELKELYFLKTNQVDKAYEQAKDLHEYESEIWSKERTKYILFADAQFENSQNQERLKEAERKRIQQEMIYQSEKKSNEIIIWTISLFLIFLSAISFLLFRLSKIRKRISQKLELKNQELAEINATKTRFFANVSHELKTPLTLILNPLQKLAKSKSLSDDDKYLVKTAEKNGLDLLELTNQVLELTAFEVRKVELNESSFNFLELLKFVYAEFESLIKNKAVAFELDYQGNEELTIISDRYKIRTVLKNLISNAAKFTSQGDTIRLTAEENEDTITIEVHDSGRGIHPNDLPHIFDRYFQTNAPKPVTEGGSGIGLAICKEYLTILDGSISVNSEYGQFTQFIIRLPKNSASEIVPLADVSSVQLSSLVAPMNPGTSDKTVSSVLIVEDNIEMLDFLKYSLSGSYNIVIARNGVEGLRILESDYRCIDLIISDAMMPVMDGFKFLQEVKGEKQFADIPFILLTALSDQDNKLRGLRAGVDDYLTKPFNHEELIARMDNLLENMAEKRAFQYSLTKDGESNTLLSFEERNAVKLSNDLNELDWLSELEQIINTNISDHNFTVDQLARKIAMSRSLLYRKVKQLTGLTPNNYISQLRYKKARFYLETKKFSTVKKVAFEVGFKDEKYFSRNFKKYFGKYPSDYL